MSSTPNDIGQVGLYNGVVVTNDYELVTGVCVLPVAEDPPTSPGELATWSPVVKLQLHAPYRRRTMTFGADKQNNPPVVPTPTDVGKFLFVEGGLSFTNRLNNTFWNFDWTVTGTYTFIENCVSRVQDGFVLGGAPFTWAPDQANFVAYGRDGTPTIGAISEGGNNAVAGFNMGQRLGQQPTGQNQYGSGHGSVLVPAWEYNCCEFFPGTLFNDEIANGGGTIDQFGQVTGAT